VTDQTVKRPQISLALKPNSKEVILKNYLVSQKGITEKELVLKALYAFYLPLALGADCNTSSSDLTKSTIDSCWSLLNQSIEIHRSIDDGDLAAIGIIDSFVKSIVPALHEEFRMGGIDSDECPPLRVDSTTDGSDTIFDNFEVNFET
jgi:hypothetical protein